MVLSQVVASVVGASVEAEVAAALSALGSLPSNEQASSSKMKIQQDLLHQLCANPRVQLQSGTGRGGFCHRPGSLPKQ